MTSTAMRSGARRVLILYNPTAGRLRRRRFDKALAALRTTGVDLVVRETKAAGDAKACAAACEEDIDVIVAAGGDGTANEVLNGLQCRVSGMATPAFAVLPLGTANVLARELALPHDLASWARLIAQGAPRALYLATLGDRYFCLMVGVGFDARVVDRLSLAFKRRLGRLAYVLQILRELVFYAPSVYRVEIDGRPAVWAASVVVTRGRRYGGRFHLAPAADVCEPGLHVCLFLAGGRLKTVKYLLGLITGSLSRMADFCIVRASRVVITGSGSDPAQVDGDSLATIPLDIRLCDRALAVIAP
jgi:YegS/Rv2252/BmrU family lipid kinase